MVDRSHLMTHEPPPFFNRGPSPTARLTFFGLMALAAMFADLRFHYLNDMRQVISVLIYPVERVMVSPLQLFGRATDYFSDQRRLLQDNDDLKRQLVEQSAKAQRGATLDAEYSHLRTLLGAADRFNTKGVLAEVVHVSRNPFSHKIMVNKGTKDGVVQGLPVIDETGVVGQITTVTSFSGEVTLLIEKDQAIPVAVSRNGLRAIAVGTGNNNTLQVPFLPTNADIRKDDLLITNGIDGTYPPGLAVASVSEVEQGSALLFSKVTALPLAGLGNHRYLMILTTPPSADYPQTEPTTPETRTDKSERTPRKAKRGTRQ
jgi:rod shape-determining protein MreC